MGLRDIERKIRIKSAFQQKEGELLLEELDQLIKNYKILEKQLKSFEKKHKKDIKENKEYYQKISELRRELGLPEEIGVYDWKESPSFMDKITGKGYFNQLAQEILEVGKSSVRDSGGLVSLAELVLRVNKVRPGKLVSPQDVVRAVESLDKNGLISGIRELESGVKLVEFVSVSLSPDQEKVFSLASRTGFITMEQLILKSKWPLERAKRVLDDLVEDGIALIDETYSEGTKYWFPSLG